MKTEDLQVVPSSARLWEVRFFLTQTAVPSHLSFDPLFQEVLVESVVKIDDQGQIAEVSFPYFRTKCGFWKRANQHLVSDWKRVLPLRIKPCSNNSN